MNLILILAAIVLISLGLAFAALFRKLVGQQNAPQAENWDHLFDPHRYRPLARLLGGQDYCYLSSQPECGRHLAHRFRVERTDIFRAYTRCLEKDFQRVASAIKIVMVQAAVDRPDLVRILFRQRLQFSAAMLMVDCRLVLFRYGLASMDLSALVSCLDTVRNELRVLALAAQPAPQGAAAF